MVGPPAGPCGGPARFDSGPPASDDGLDAFDVDGDGDGVSDKPGAGVRASQGSARSKVSARTRHSRVFDDAAYSAVGTGVAWNDDPEPVAAPHSRVAMEHTERLPARSSRALTPSQSIEVALSACVRRACDLPSRTPVGQVASSSVRRSFATHGQGQELLLYGSEASRVTPSCG